MQTPIIVVFIGILAFFLGTAIQRGSTCAVRAVDDLIYRRRADMFIGFFECSLWALFIVWVAQSTITVPDWASVLWLCAGAIMFGIGATINDACAFGSIARLGTGRLDYLLTGLGVWVAYYILDLLSIIHPPGKTMPFEGGSVWIVLLGLPSMILLRWWLRRRPAHQILRLSLIMAIIGICGSLLTILDQPWPWMRALQLINDTNLINIFAFTMLLAGSVVSGITAGRFRPEFPRFSELRNRFVGGLFMGSASVIIPGGNDSIILRGMSSGDGRAFLGYLMILISIAATLMLFKQFAKQVA